MPWAIVVRWLARIVVSLVLWRIATSRRRAFAGGAGPGGPASARHVDAQAIAGSIVESSVLAGRLVVTAVLTGAAVLLLVAGVTIVVLSPRWLGALLLGAAAAASLGAWLEGRVVTASVRRRLRGRHDDELRHSAG